MHIFRTKQKMKSACLLHKDRVTFLMLHLYIINLTRKKSLRVAFLLFIMILLLSKRQSLRKPCDVQHHYLRANCSVEIDANLESTGLFEQQKNPLACRSLFVYLYFLMKTRLAYSSLFTEQLVVQLNRNHNPQFRLRSVEYLATNVYPITLSRTSQKTKKPYCYSMRCKLVTGYSTVRLF